MGVIKTRRGTTKLGPLGRRVVRFKSRNINRLFAVHEDLLCATSNVFRQRLQQRRKAIEGDCSICSEELDAKVADITFCRPECGQNFHVHYLEKWEQSLEGQLICPMCRKIWEKVSPAADLDLTSAIDLDPKAIQNYVDWLYTGTIHVDSKVSPKSDEYNVCLLKAWTVADAAGDKAFQHAIVAQVTSQYASKVNPGFGIESIKYAFNVAKIATMRAFVVRLIENSGSVLNLSQDWVHLPEAFKIYTAAHKHDMLEHWVKRYTGGEYKLDDHEVDKQPA